MNDTQNLAANPSTGLYSPLLDPHAPSDRPFDYHGYQVVRRGSLLTRRNPRSAFAGISYMSTQPV